MADFGHDPRSSEIWTGERGDILFFVVCQATRKSFNLKKTLYDSSAVAQIAERFKPNTVLWAFDTIQPSSWILQLVSIGGAVVQRVRHLGLRSVGRGFKSCSRQRCVTTLGKLFSPMYLCHQAV